MQKLSKERSHLEAAAAKLQTLAVKAGAEVAEVCATYSVSTKISLEKQDFHMASTDDGYNLGLRVLIKTRQGFASCNSTEANDLKDVANKAVEIARVSPENPYYNITTSENISREAPEGLWDNSLHELSLQTQKDWTKLLVDEATKDKRFRLNDGATGITTGLYLVLNSLGTHKLERESTVSWNVMGMGVDGDQISSFDYFSNMARKTQGVLEQIRSTTAHFRDGVLATLKTGPGQSYKGVVAFSPRAVNEVLLAPLAYHLNGRNVVEGTSRWKVKDLGGTVLSPKITLTDRPWLTDRFGCTLFDREGTPTQNRIMLENGAIREFYADNYAAKALGRKSTGHAVGGPSAVPSVSPHCSVLSPGTESREDLIRQISSQRSEFLLVRRFSGQVDPVTGDFSGVAKGGEWWKNGERVHFVKETLISGNFLEVLGAALVGLSSQTEVINSGNESPTLFADNVSVTCNS